MTAEIMPVAPEAVPAIAARLVEVYHAAFGPPPYARGIEAAEVFSEAILRHADRPGFRCRIAVEHDRILGFAYGHTAEPGQWWWDEVTRVLPGPVVDRWLRGAFVLMELAVTPPAQGRGMGGRLHDSVLSDLPHPTAVLSTIQVETAATALYRKRGWIVIARDVLFPGVLTPYVVMGRDLGPGAR